jgi:hypothetical protein
MEFILPHHHFWEENLETLSGLIEIVSLIDA